MCVSENVALIGGSVAVMRYQPPANKRINIRRWRWRWTRRRRKLAWVREGEDDDREREGGRGEQEKWCLLQTQEEEPGDRRKPATQSPTDTMLRLNIRCLNNQARFDSRRLPRGDEREKYRERESEGENVCSNVRASKRDTRERELRSRRERERRRGRGGERDSGSDRVGIEHVLRRSSFSIRARFSSLSTLLPPLPSLAFAPFSYTSSDLTSLRRIFPLAVLTLSVYTYYAKQVTVGGLGSQTRSV